MDVRRRSDDGSIQHIITEPSPEQGSLEGDPLFWVDMVQLEGTHTSAMRLRLRHSDLEVGDRRIRFVVDVVGEDEDDTDALVYVQPARNTLTSPSVTEGVLLRPLGLRKDIVSGAVQSRRGMITFADTGGMLEPAKLDEFDNPEEREDDFEDDYQIGFLVSEKPYIARIRRNDLRYVLKNGKDVKVYRLVVTYDSRIVLANFRYVLTMTDPKSNALGVSMQVEELFDVSQEPEEEELPLTDKDEDEEDEDDDEDDSPYRGRRRSIGYLSGYTPPKKHKKMPNTI